MTAAAPAPPPLDEGLEQLLRRMRLPHMRRIAPEVIATAKAQRWDPAEVLRALLAEEVACRDRSSLATRRARAAFPTGKTFDAWDERLSSVPAPTQSALRTLEWVGRTRTPSVGLRHRENVPGRGPRPGRRRRREERRLVHPRAARRPAPPALRRRLRDQGHLPHPAGRPRRRRRHRPSARRPRRRRRALPPRRRRLRAPQRRGCADLIRDTWRPGRLLGPHDAHQHRYICQIQGRQVSSGSVDLTFMRSAG